MFRELEKSRILVVEDIRFNQMMISHILVSHGYDNFEFASTGKEALDKINQNAPDAVLLDLILPDMDGMAICEALRGSPTTEDIPIIIQSSVSQPEQKKLAFQLGANDFINKPIDPLELVSRIKLQLEQKKLTSSLKEVNSRLKNELEDANRLLLSYLPSDSFLQELKESYGFDVACYYKSSSELGGDFYNFYEIDSGKFGYYMWDFSGHGVKAAINTFRLLTLVNYENLESNSPGHFVTALNGLLTRFNSAAFYATMFFCVFDKSQKYFDYSFASCPSPILVSFKNKKFHLIPTKEFPVGIKRDYCYSNYRQSYEGYDVMVCYSDALIETYNNAGAFLTPEDIAKLLLRNGNENMSSRELMDLVLDKFQKEYEARLCDDLTINVIKFPEII